MLSFDGFSILSVTQEAQLYLKYSNCVVQTYFVIYINVYCQYYVYAETEKFIHECKRSLIFIIYLSNLRLCAANFLALLNLLKGKSRP
jgi:hypothetical protein